MEDDPIDSAEISDIFWRLFCCKIVGFSGWSDSYDYCAQHYNAGMSDDPAPNILAQL
jgi:hypothetical protein